MQITSYFYYLQISYFTMFFYGGTEIKDTDTDTS